MAKKSPTARSLELLREMGYTCQVVEYFHAPSRRRRDFLGCIDIIGAHSVHGILGVQATDDTDHSKRARKARGCDLEAWLSHARMEVWSWGLRGPRGERKLWTCRIERIKVSELTRLALQHIDTRSG